LSERTGYRMNSGRLWRWSPDQESLVTLSRSLKDLSCSQLSRYPALYLYLKIRSIALQNTAATGSLVPPQRDLQFLRILAVRILSLIEALAVHDSWLFGTSVSEGYPPPSESARSRHSPLEPGGPTGLTDLTVPYHNFLLLSNTYL
jgi:hypothetical protein